MSIILTKKKTSSRSDAYMLEASEIPGLSIVGSKDKTIGLGAPLVRPGKHVTERFFFNLVELGGRTPELCQKGQDGQHIDRVSQTREVESKADFAPYINTKINTG